jgi:hypothetical protein
MIDRDVNITAHAAAALNVAAEQEKRRIFSGRVAIEEAMKEKRKIHLLR